MMPMLLVVVLAAVAAAPPPSGPAAPAPPPVRAAAPSDLEAIPVAAPAAPGRMLPAPAPTALAPPDLPPLPEAAAPVGPRAPVGIEDLKALYREADLIVQFQVETVQAKTDINPRLTWEVRGPVLEVIKGSLLPGQMAVHVDSVIRAFDMRRSEMEGRQFLAAVKPLGDAAQRRFQLVGPYAFLADSGEAQALRQLAASDVEKGSGNTTLELAVRPLQPVYPVTGPKMIEVRLTNTGADSATYLQAPICEKEGRLYLTGQGMIRIRDLSGRLVPDKGTLALGQVPPPPPTPALILPKASFVETIDLARYFELSEGRYTLVLALATPDGRGRIASNGFSFQVGAVNLPEAPRAPAAAPTGIPAPVGPAPAPPAPRPPEAAPPLPAETVSLEPPLPTVRRPAAPAVEIPEPAKYQPGKSTAGVAGLLRPSKARFAINEPVDLEFRLINQGPRTVAVDARLERTLTLQVQPVGDSPKPDVVRQVIAWPPDGAAMPEERAYLREGAFWGRTINLNMLFGKSLEDLTAPTPEEVAAGKTPSYERFGKILFGFPKPGVYTVTAAYQVARQHPAGGSGDPAREWPKEWWIGDIQTNAITIQIGEPGK
jgi:hypothetical protein